MSTQPEALRLAEIGQYLEGGEKARWSMDVCAELRRLHAANLDCVEHFNAVKAERDELLAALKELLDCPAGDYDTTDDYENAVKRALAAVARAEA